MCVCLWTAAAAAAVAGASVIAATMMGCERVCLCVYLCHEFAIIACFHPPSCLCLVARFSHSHIASFTESKRREKQRSALRVAHQGKKEAKSSLASKAPLTLSTATRVRQMRATHEQVLQSV